jgi:hypothetical protein
MANFSTKPMARETASKGSSVRPNVSARKEQGYGVVRSFNAFAVPADPDTLCRGGAEPGVQALVDDRVLRFEEQLFGENWVS